MRKLLLTLSLLISIAYGQLLRPIHNGQDIDYLEAQLYFGLPFGSTVVNNTSSGNPGALFYSTTDSLVYVFDGTNWHPVSAGGSFIAGWDDMLAQNQAQTTDRTIHGGGNNLTFSGISTLIDSCDERHEIVGGYRVDSVESDDSLKVAGSRVEQIEGDKYETVGGDENETVQGTKNVTISNDYHETVASFTKIASGAINEYSDNRTDSTTSDYTVGVGGDQNIRIAGTRTEQAYKHVLKDASGMITADIGAQGEVTLFGNDNITSWVKWHNDIDGSFTNNIRRGANTIQSLNQDNSGVFTVSGNDGSTGTHSFYNSLDSSNINSGISKITGSILLNKDSVKNYVALTNTILVLDTSTGKVLRIPLGTFLTANQNITLSGDISGSGTTAITTTIGSGKVTNSMLAGSIAFAKLIGTDITALGTITTGTWQGTAIADAYISSATNWNTAYTNRITSLTTTGASGTATLSSNTLNIPTYTLTGLGGVPTSRTITINGTALDLSADRSWTTEVPLTFSAGLTRSGNTITVNTSQNISTLSNLTTNGFVKTSGGTGALSIDNNTYLTGNQTITLSGDITGIGSTSITGTLATVNSNTGSIGDASHSLTINANAKGLIVSAVTNAIQIAESQVTNLASDLSAKQDAITGAATTITSSNLTASRALASDGSGKVGVATTTLTELNYVSGVTSAIQTQFTNKQDVSLSAYTFRANNTNATANATNNTFQDAGQQTYTGTITWTGTTAPSGSTNHTYHWNQIGKLVTLRLNLVYSVAGAALIQVVCTLPTDCPTPEIPTGLAGNSDEIAVASMMMTTSLTTFPSAPTVRCMLRINSGSTGYEIIGAQTGASYQNVYITLQYYAQ